MARRWITNHFQNSCSECNVICKKEQLVLYDDYLHKIFCEKCADFPIPHTKITEMMSEIIRDFIKGDIDNAKKKYDDLLEYENEVFENKPVQEQSFFDISQDKISHNSRDEIESVMKKLSVNDKLKKLCESSFRSFIRQYKKEFYRNFLAIVGDKKVLNRFKNNSQANRILTKAGKEFYEEFQPQNTFLIKNDSPYKNREILFNIIKNSKNYIYWYEPYFEEVGFEYLSLGLIENKNISEIKIITHFKDDKINKLPSMKLLERFKLFQGEVGNEFGIKFNLKVITKKEIMKQTHRRFIMSSDESWIVPSVYQIQEGQNEKIKKDTDKLKDDKEYFLELWHSKDSLDVVKDWKKLSEYYEPKKYSAKCSDCNSDTQLPFKPDEVRPVYCKKCLPNHRKNNN